MAWVLVGTNPPRDWGDKGPEVVISDYLENNWDVETIDPVLTVDSIRWNELYSGNNDLFIKVMRGPSDSTPMTLGWGEFYERYEIRVIVAARSLVDTYPDKSSEYFLDRIEDYIKRVIGRDPDALESEGILLVRYVRAVDENVKGTIAESNVTDVKARANIINCWAIHTGSG